MPDQRHRHGPGPGFRPPWWPEGEAFPPASGEQWMAARGRFLRRIAIGIGLFLVFVFVIGWLGAVFGGGFHRGEQGGRFFPGFWLIPVLLIVGFLVFGRAVRRTARPIGEVMDAAAKVAEGDLSARVDVEGPTDVRDLARSFNRMAERLETTERQRRDLLADVAHELRTPLAVIRGRVEGIRDGLYASDADHLALIEEETRVMARLLDDLQLLSNAEAGALRLHPERLEPRELIETAEAAHRAEADERGVAFRSQLAPDLPALDVDRVRIGEVLANLISNALRHTPAGGTVFVAADLDDGGVAFRVADTGEGIDPDQLANVFDRFARSPESRGSGLGLAIAKSLVQAHGGTISAESEPGRGATIRFVLPAA
ncbi:MAG TPA: HAMP domain-containing sensor histidine kinase [Actinomycetota bacterium]|nr:HAMP domain-containing sensor histidine kinase [Actinomycetota bacterium]